MLSCSIIGFVQNSIEVQIPFWKFIEEKLPKIFIRVCCRKNFNIEDRELWQNIYRSKMKEIFDKSVAEFNYTLLNNILNKSDMVSKWNKEVQKILLCMLNISRKL